MQDAIQPLHRLPFTDISPEGVQGIAMNPVAPTVYVHIHQSFVDPVAAALAYWPWVLTPIAALLLAFVLERTLRILARPQRKGVPHCRRCNYDLSGAAAAATTAPLSLAALSKGEGRGEGSPSSDLSPPSTSEPSSSSSSSSSCPECGRPLTPRTTRQGRSTRRRLSPLAIPIAALLALATLAITLATGWRPTLAPYPSPLAQRIVDRLGLTLPARFIIDCPTIIEADLATGAAMRTVVCRGPVTAHFSVTPTGTAIVAASRVKPLGVVAFSTQHGRVLHRLDFPPAPSGAGSIEMRVRINDPIWGYTADGAAAFVAVPDYGPPARTTILKWNLSDGSTTLHAVLPTFLTEESFERVRNGIVLPGDSAPVVSWCDDADSSLSRTCILEVRSGDAPPRLTVDAGLGCRRLSRSAITADGSRLVVLRSHPHHARGVNQHQFLVLSTADLRPLDMVTIPGEAMTAYAADDPAGRFVAVAGGNTVALWDAPASGNRWIPLVVPSDIQGVAKVAFSNDGQFLTAFGMCDAPSGAPGLGYQFHVLIWDLAKLGSPAAPPPR